MPLPSVPSEWEFFTFTSLQPIARLVRRGCTNCGTNPFCIRLWTCVLALTVAIWINWYGASQLAANLTSLDRPERHGILVFDEHTISRDDRIGVGLAFRHFIAGKLLEFLIAGFEDDQ